MGDNDTLKKQYSRALKQIVDTVAPAMNPKRREKRVDAVEDETSNDAHSRQTTDRHNSY